MRIKSYSELSQLKTFEERFEYLKIGGKVGENTFGFDRVFNQIFYKSVEWRAIRDYIIVRDNCCDLGIEGYDIFGKIYIHHINPISIEDIEKKSDFLLNPEFLITTTHNTHNAIHYSDKSLLCLKPIERRKNDTCPWRN